MRKCCVVHSIALVIGLSRNGKKKRRVSRYRLLCDERDRELVERSNSMAVKTVYHEIGNRGRRTSTRKRRTAVRRTVAPRTGFDTLFLKLAAAALRLDQSRSGRR